MQPELIDRFLGLAYCPRHMDCADLTLLVQCELFGRAVQLPGKRPRPLNTGEQAESIANHCGLLAVPTELPQTGDAVLMREIGAVQAGHIGTYFFFNYTPYVLHTSHALGGSVLHRLQDLSGFGLTVEGYYRWK